LHNSHIIPGAEEDTVSAWPVPLCSHVSGYCPEGHFSEDSSPKQEHEADYSLFAATCHGFYKRTIAQQAVHCTVILPTHEAKSQRGNYKVSESR